jgi:hypothetical protein
MTPAVATDQQPVLDQPAPRADEPDQAENTRSAWLRSARAGGGVWLAAVLGAVLVSWLSRINDKASIGLHGIISSWGRYDWLWYRQIAEHGYAQLKPDDLQPAAFFPLYPVLVRAVDVITPGGPLGGALAISAASALGMFVVLHRLVDREFGTDTARRTMLYLAAFPTGFFLLTPYPLALFLLLTVAAFFGMRTGRWWVAGALCALATATRSSGVLLAVPFCYEYLRQRDFNPRRIRLDVLAIALVPAGLLAFMAYTNYLIGNPLAPMRAQAFWHRAIAPPWVGIVDSARWAVRMPLLIGQVNLLYLGSTLLALAALVLMVVGPWRMRRDQLAFPLLCAAEVLFMISFPASGRSGHDGGLLSASRLVLEIFPIFVLLATIGGRHRLFDRIYLFTGLVMQGSLLTAYLHNAWIA